MSSSSQTLAALHALFEPAPVAIEPEPELPTNLDTHVLADAAAAWDLVGYRWYNGVDTRGVLHIFRFQRGNSLEKWHALLHSQKLQTVGGPFRTQSHAQAGPR